MKNAFFGGSFDPIHNGHLLIAEQLLEYYKLDKIYFCPTYLSPNKNKFFSSPEDRLNMVKLAIENNKNFDYLDLEIKRKGISYTIDTIIELYEKQNFLGEKLYVILSKDLHETINQWKNYEKLLDLVNLIIFDRYKNNTSYFVFMPISSTLIREQLKKIKTIRYLVPENVRKYIIDKGLYLE